MDKPVKCFIVEGEDRDLRIVSRMAEVFFRGKYEVIMIVLPASENIYMLYQEMQANLFDMDLVEFLRDRDPEIEKTLEGIERQQIDEVFLFFDYDIHQNNLPNDQDDPLVKLEAMLRFFDNETENGKFYINYPMIEALYDYEDGQCDAFSKCLFPVNELAQYKEKSGKGNPHASLHFGKHSDWRMVLSLFGLRIQCLFEIEEISYLFYKEYASAYNIFMKQKKLFNDYGAVFVLSAFPEFLLDYYKEDFWKAHITRRKKHFIYCSKETEKQKS